MNELTPEQVSLMDLLERYRLPAVAEFIKLLLADVAVAKESLERLSILLDSLDEGDNFEPAIATESFAYLGDIRAALRGDRG